MIEKKPYLMGDTHGDEFTMCNLVKDLNEKDIVIHVGDHGINFFGNNVHDLHLKEQLSKTKPIWIFVKGNHDRDFHIECQSIENYEYKYYEGNGIKGNFYIDDRFPNQLFCNDYNLFTIDDNLYLTINGAFSVDGEYRRRRGWTWFEDEQLSDDTIAQFKQECIFNIIPHKVDYIITHTCPLKYEPTHLFLPFIEQSKVDKKTEVFLDWVDENIEYQHWYFGHYHNNENTWDKGTMLFESIKEID